MKPETLEQIKKQLIIDEGVRLEVYKDSLGYYTVGIGHLITAEDNLQYEQRITQEQCDNLFAADLNRTIHGCERDIEGWKDFPDEVQEILVNMAFNLGINGLCKFVNTLNLLRNKQYNEAADALVDSKWYGQVGNRSKRIVARLRALQSTPIVVEAHVPHDLLGKHVLCKRDYKIVEYHILQISPSGDYIKVGIENASETQWISYTDFVSDFGVIEFLD